MKKIKTNILAFAFLAMGTFVGVTSCSKDKVEEDKCSIGENPAGSSIEGIYAGTHNLKIPPAILKALSEGLPPDSATGLPTDLTKGFEDTLEVRIVGGVAKITSSLLGITIDGEITDTYTVKINETKYDELNLGTVVSAKKASIATRVPVKFNLRSAECPTIVELKLKAKEIASLPIALDIPTTGNFIKIKD